MRLAKKLSRNKLAFSKNKKSIINELKELSNYYHNKLDNELQQLKNGTYVF